VNDPEKTQLKSAGAMAIKAQIPFISPISSAGMLKAFQSDVA
jgi:hypothetical protein